jgi:1-aminocyclopropane-1-carboxylate deaminase/D-cysteine desulfhydrase-like pyridoxal-dependent ACC family enzyme
MIGHEAMDLSRARDALAALPRAGLVREPSPLHEMARLRAALDGGPRLLVKRDDALPLAFGGNKVRKLDLVAAQAMAEGADTLVTCGGLQSNHARATAAAAARLGLRAALVLSGPAPEVPRGNTLLDSLMGAEIVHVPRPEDRVPGMEEVAERLRRQGRRPHVIPLGASTPLGACALAAAVGELARQAPPPTAIVHASSSAGTQAGLVAGVILHELATTVVGISADEPAAALAAQVRTLVAGVGDRLGLEGQAFAARGVVEVDDGFIGEGYGLPTPASREARDLAARNEALFVDDTYTAKALAGLIARVRQGRYPEAGSVVFWHTGGQVALLA